MTLISAKSKIAASLGLAAMLLATAALAADDDFQGNRVDIDLAGAYMRSTESQDATTAGGHFGVTYWIAPTDGLGGEFQYIAAEGSADALILGMATYRHRFLTDKSVDPYLGAGFNHYSSTQSGVVGNGFHTVIGFQADWFFFEARYYKDNVVEAVIGGKPLYKSP